MFIYTIKLLLSNFSASQLWESNALTGLSVGALTVETANTIDAGSAIEAGCTRAIVDVDAAIGPSPAIYAYARVAAG